MAFISFALLIIGGFSLGGVWLLKNQDAKPTATASDFKPSPAAISHTTTAKREPSYTNKKIFIRSNPSNAGIYINNQFTRKYTPNSLKVDLTSASVITIKKTGFKEQKIQITEQEFKNSIFVNLVKDNNIQNRPTRIIQQ